MFTFRAPSPALVIAVAALFIALSGTAVAAGIVPLAKRALNADKAKTAAVADNAKKLGGQTSAQIASVPGPASSAAGLVSVKTAPFSLNPQQGQMFTVPCASGEKALSGGFTYDSNALILSVDSLPTGNDGGWQLYLTNVSQSDAGSGTLQAVCVK
jgi:hypothetical protein